MSAMIDRRSLEGHPDPGYQAMLKALHKRALSGDTVATISDIARALDLSRQAVSRWDKVPAKHVLRIEELTGVSRHVLRPDIYPPSQKKGGRGRR